MAIASGVSNVKVFYDGHELPVSLEQQDSLLEQLEPGFIGFFNPLRSELETILAPLDTEDVPDTDESWHYRDETL